jgi:hypothetical protein
MLFRGKTIEDVHQISSVRIGIESGESIFQTNGGEFYICYQTGGGFSEQKIPCLNWTEVYDFMCKRHKQISVSVTSISWDTDGEKVELPSSLSFMVDKEGDLNYNICRYLSDEYGYCVLDYSLGD